MGITFSNLRKREQAAQGAQPKASETEIEQVVIKEVEPEEVDKEDTIEQENKADQVEVKTASKRGSKKAGDK